MAIDWTIDAGDAETDRIMLCGIYEQFEIRDLDGTEPGRTLRLERMEREGLIVKTYWYDITDKGKELMQHGKQP